MSDAFYNDPGYQSNVHLHHPNLNPLDVGFTRLTSRNPDCGLTLLNGHGITSFMEVIAQTYTNSGEIKIYINSDGWVDETERFNYMHSVAVVKGQGSVPTLDEVVNPDNQRKYSTSQLLMMLSHEITEIRSKHLLYNDTLPHHVPINVFVDDTCFDDIADFLFTFGDSLAKCKIHFYIDARSMDVRKALVEFKQNYVLIGDEAIPKGNTHGLLRLPRNYNIVHAFVMDYQDDPYFLLVPIPALWWSADEQVYKQIPLLLGETWNTHLKFATDVHSSPTPIKLSPNRFYQYPEDTYAKPPKDYSEGISVLVTSLNLSDVMEECRVKLDNVGMGEGVYRELLYDSFWFVVRSFTDSEAILSKTLKWVKNNPSTFFNWCTEVLKLKTPKHELYKLFSNAALDDPENSISQVLADELRSTGFPPSRDSISSLLKIQSSVANQFNIRTDYYIRKRATLV